MKWLPRLLRLTGLNQRVPLCHTAVREWVSGHCHACVHGLPARPPACSLPRPCAGTASQAPNVLTSTSVCRDCQPGPQRAHFQVCVQGLPARPPACSLPRLCAGTASHGPSVLTSKPVCRDCQPGPQRAHFHVCVQGLPARAPACSLPRPGTASQGPSMLPHLPLLLFLQSFSRRERRELQA